MYFCVVVKFLVPCLEILSTKQKYSNIPHSIQYRHTNGATNVSKSFDHTQSICSSGLTDVNKPLLSNEV